LHFKLFPLKEETLISVQTIHETYRMSFGQARLTVPATSVMSVGQARLTNLETSLKSFGQARLTVLAPTYSSTTTKWLNITNP
jgi:hypothetical protein